MRIMQAIHSGRVTVDLAVSDRPSALMALAQAFADHDKRLSPSAVNDALTSREHLASTNVGHGVAIPHARVAGLGEPQLAISIAREGVAFDDPNQPVHILVGLLSDADDPASHLQLLSSLVRTLAQPRVRYEIAASETVDDVLQALALSEHGPQEVSLRLVGTC